MSMHTCMSAALLDALTNWRILTLTWKKQVTRCFCVKDASIIKSGPTPNFPPSGNPLLTFRWTGPSINGINIFIFSLYCCRLITTLVLASDDGFFRESLQHFRLPSCLLLKRWLDQSLVLTISWWLRWSLYTRQLCEVFAISFTTSNF